MAVNIEELSRRKMHGIRHNHSPEVVQHFTKALKLQETMFQRVARIFPQYTPALTFKKAGYRDIVIA